MIASYFPVVSRRTTLQWIAATSLTSALPLRARAGTSAVIEFEPTQQGYGTDPNLNNPVVPWHRIMKPHQLRQTAILADLILPGSQTAPAPSALGISDFIDEWVSAPYPQQQDDRKIILEGLAWIDEESGRRGRKGFVELDDHVRQAILEDIAQVKAGSAFATQNAFFKCFRFLVVTAYYTTPEGFQDIGYTGNVALESYPSITEEERAILESALAKLGLSPT